MPKIVTWTISPHVRGGIADESLSKGRNSLKTNLLAYCRYQHISARARQMINTLTDCHGDQRCVRSARLEFQKIKTLTYCQGISNVFGQRGSSSTEDQHTHVLSRDQRYVQSARLKLNRGSTQSPPVKRSAMCSVSEAQAPEVQYTHQLSRDQRHVWINTLTRCQGVSDMFGQRGSSSTEDQHTHLLSRNQRRVRSARLEHHVQRIVHSPPVKGFDGGVGSSCRKSSSDHSKMWACGFGGPKSLVHGCQPNC
jgi:hypothetical protein